MDDHRIPPTRGAGLAPRPDLYAIVYVSTAAKAVTMAELMHLLEGARRRNAEEGVTGLLLYSDRRFMQYLEGPAAALYRVYDTVKHHPLHYGLIDLIRQPLQEREFADWAMAFHLVDAFGQASPVEQDARLADRLAERLRISSRPPSPACGLLSEFWVRGRGSIATALGNHGNARTQQLASGLDTGTGD
jgi:hypothetical protein